MSKFEQLYEEYNSEKITEGLEAEQVEKKVSKALAAPHLGIIVQDIDLDQNGYYEVELHKDVKLFHGYQLKKLLKAFPDVTIRQYADGTFFLAIKK